jgi:hypothetical protein
MPKPKRKKPTREGNPGKKPPKLKDLVDAITAENRYAEISLGTERGKEKVEW